MRTDLFDFELPREAIAQAPARPRDSARLLAVGQDLSDHSVSDLPSLLRPGDLLVCNDTRVLPTRLAGRRGTAKIEATLHKDLGGGRWRAFARPAKKLNTGDRIDFAEGFSAEVAGKHEAGEITLAFAQDGAALSAALQRHGAMPLPPYIRRNGAGQPQDRQDYQTIFAQVEGAVAAPTAGLHFTERLLAALDERGTEKITVTLHVGAGTFLPVKSDEAEDHVMHGEWGQLSAAAVAKIESTRAAGGRIVAVGTTALRLLESAIDETGRLAPFEGETKLFILPGYRFAAVDLLLTNFHLPRSTLFMLVSAFAGTERMKAAYRHALDAGYRFYSYGDATLLQREDQL
ncbi:MAG: tRNA preQ1(34) S-adenosylmethionine ribosyltransferase-isomerase QueA [Pseudomonadota bacterium]